LVKPIEYGVTPRTRILLVRAVVSLWRKESSEYYAH